MINSRIVAITEHLPEIVLGNDELARLYPEWSAEKILEKTGIRERRVCDANETAGDLAEQAARRLLVAGGIDPASIGFLILVTQSPDYFLPTTACLLQHRLGLPTTCGALDVNLGCSGYIYGLSLAKGLIAAGIARHVLLLTTETYSKYIHPRDKSVRTLFGDGAAATLISVADAPGIGAFVLGTDGGGFQKLIVPAGGMRLPRSAATAVEQTDVSGNVRSRDHLFMDGPEIFSFTITTVPRTVQETLAANGLALEAIDLFVFHQANKYMLDFLCRKCKIDPTKFYMNFADCGNTVSASIPIALARAVADGSLRPGMKVMLVGFGVGLSWGATVVTW
jgi:3-oxoacyl-[acyl-carrier-protein] synthase-3